MTAPAVTEEGACSGSECFALRVLGEDMAPEFRHGEIIVVEPGGVVRDGSYVLAQVAGEWLFRRLSRQYGGDGGESSGEGGGCRGTAGAWRLEALNPDCREHAVVPLADLAAVRGVVIQKAVPGRRRLSKFYV